MAETGPLCRLAGSSLHVSVKELIKEDILLQECMYLVLTHMPGESYCRRLRSLLLCLCDVF